MAITEISEVIICIVFKSNYYSAYYISKCDVRIVYDIIMEFQSMERTAFLFCSKSRSQCKYFPLMEARDWDYVA